jgi:DNA-binding CsgD family transcriptional regulator
MTDLLKQTALLDRLTPKQKEVLGYIADGMTSKEIGRKLGISESAVNQRIETIRQRLDGMPRVKIAQLYRRQSTLLITIPPSNPLTGKTLQLQAGTEPAQAWSPEGAVDLTAPDAGERSGRLQPSTLPSIWNGPGAIWVRIGAIVAIAFGLVAFGVLLLDMIDKLARLLGTAC